jgi:hypothetical protein
MKAQAIDTLSRTRAPAAWRAGPPTIAAGLLAQARGLEIVAALATRLAVALLPALAIVIGSVLAVSTPGMEVYLQALLWTGGFLFYGRAFDAGRPHVAALLVVTGIAVQALAWVSDRLAPELAVAAATLVAAWVAAIIATAVFRRT